MRLLLFLPLLLVASCSAAQTPSSAPTPPTRVELSGGGVDFYIAPDTREARSRLPAPPAEIWALLHGYYLEHGIPLETVDQPNWTLGNRGYLVSRSLGGRRLSFFLDCGSTMLGARADTERVQVSVVSVLEEIEGGTLLRTRVTGTTRPSAGASGNPVACVSSGQLELRFAALIEESL
jgi:hypothetical protein